VSITGRNEVNLNKTKEICVKAGLTDKQVIETVGDINDPKVQKAIVDNTVKAFGRIDILVNNAGFGEIGASCATGNEKQYDSVFETNVKSVVFLTQLCLPHLEKTKGNIVNVSSVAGLRPFPDWGFYAMSKAALDQFTRCLALEMAPKGVRVNAVNPGTVRTPALAKQRFCSGRRNVEPHR